ncbi:MAG: hypothetical protein NTY22_05795 [Proteobacteria bacterium]|nr:hypothetical protein [Pseudomonadota bacterium]
MKKVLLVLLVAGFVFCTVAEAKKGKHHKKVVAKTPTEQTAKAPAATTPAPAKTPAPATK